MFDLTLWKTDPIPKKGLVVDYLQPIGHPRVISNMLLDLPGVRPFFGCMIKRGYVSLSWKDKVVFSFKEEPEFGRGGAYSILIDRDDLTEDKSFFCLYVMVHEMLGVILLDSPKGKFVPVQEYRNSIN